ncbi:MAG TPA: membrane protein insertion efficiency factor YidD [Dermatophilaceae bacterium]
MPFASVRFPPGRFPSVHKLVIAPAIALIRAYQLIVSPMRPPTCRFYPSCSSYALTAIERFGLVRGSWLATRRLLRCHPWNPGGVDHVPAPPPRQRTQ